MVANTTNGAADVVINKARLSPGRQWIGIDNIVLDEKFQPRAKTDFDWVHDLSGFRKDGSEFPPVKIFQLPDARLVAASGFHRIPAMKMAGEETILCDVVDGTEEDAVIFAAGSNKGNGVKPMGPKDITKAVEMLLVIDKWWKASAAAIASHVGCHRGKVSRIRMRIAASTNRPLPEMVETAEGKQRRITSRKHQKARRISRSSKGSYQAKFYGTRIRGKSREEVQRRLDDLYKEKEEVRTSFKDKDGRDFLQRVGFSPVFPGGVSFGGLRAFSRGCVLAIGCDLSDVSCLPSAIGKLIAARRHKGDHSARMVVLCYPEDGPEKVIDLYRQEGFEFMTPEELVEELKASGDGGEPDGDG